MPTVVIKDFSSMEKIVLLNCGVTDMFGGRNSFENEAEENIWDTAEVVTRFLAYAARLSHVCDGLPSALLGLSQRGGDATHFISIMVRQAPKLTAHAVTLRHRSNGKVTRGVI